MRDEGEKYMNLSNLPKIELHCHLDGSVRPETIIDIARKENIDIPSYDVKKINDLMIAPIECTSLDEYLKRFSLPINIMQSEYSLRRVTYELLEDAAKENVKYMEIRFAPLLHRNKGLEVEKIIESVLMGMKDAEDKYDINANLILSFMKTMPVEGMFEVINIGRKYLGKGVVAVDLCGPEEAGFAKFFVEPMSLAKSYGYRITIHAGETGIGENVLESVELLGAERIGHGVYIKDCKKAYDIIKEKNIALEICPTSNVQTKAVKKISEHPIYDFYKDGIKVTMNTDNRTVSNTNMTNEFSAITNEFNMDYEDYKEIYYNSLNVCFADDEIKDKLRKYMD